MSQVIPLDVYRLRETNEKEVARTLKIVGSKKAKVQNQSKMLKNKVDNLRHENILLEKKIRCTESLNLKKEKEILQQKKQSEEYACSLELNLWKTCKTEMLKEFENEKNESINKKRKYEQLDQTHHGNSCDEEKLIYTHFEKSSESDGVKMLKGRINELTGDIENKRKVIQMTDPKMNMDIQMLHKRNAALLLRYQRQLQEAESRQRQTLSELKSLEKLSAEKNALLFKQN